MKNWIFLLSHPVKSGTCICHGRSKDYIRFRNVHRNDDWNRLFIFSFLFFHIYCVTSSVDTSWNFRSVCLAISELPLLMTPSSDEASKLCETFSILLIWTYNWTHFLNPNLLICNNEFHTLFMIIPPLFFLLIMFVSL